MRHPRPRAAVVPRLQPPANPPRHRRALPPLRWAHHRTRHHRPTHHHL